VSAVRAESAAAAGTLAAFVAAATFWLVAGGVRVTQEDGFYYLKIAQNMAEGRGSTFDGLHPTNGYQPLWLLCLVPVFSLAPSPAAAASAATLLQAALLAAGVALVVRLARESGLDIAAAAVAGGAWIALTFRTGLSGVEFALTSALLAAVALVLRRHAGPAPASPRTHAGLGLLLGLAVLARLDNALLALLVAAHWIPRARRGPGGATRIAALLLPIALLGGGYLLSNVILFGHAAPVSGVVKQGWSLHLLASDPVYQSRGWLAAKAMHLARPLLHPGGAAMPALLFGGALPAALLAATRLRPGTLPALSTALPPLAPLVLFAALQPLAYGLVYHGHYTYAPWYYAAQPILAVLLAGGAVQTLLRAMRPALAATAAAVTCGAMLAVCLAGVRRSGMPPAADGPLYVAARWARDHLGEGARVGTWNAGAIGFLSGRQVVNLDGVVNTFAFLEREQYDLCGYWTRNGITHLVDVFEAREGSVAMKGATLPVAAFYAGCTERLELVWSDRPPGNPGWPKAFRIRPPGAARP
jgi:hypothetical protein